MIKRNIIVSRITTSGLLVALSIILGRIFVFPQGPTFYRISLGNVPIIFASLLLGPIYGGIVGAASDIVGSTAVWSGNFLPWPFISATLYGIIPYFIVFLMKKMPAKLKFPLFYITALAFYVFVVVYLFQNNKEIDIQKLLKLEFEFNTLSLVLFSVFITVFFGALLTTLIVLKVKNNERFDNKITSSLVNLSYSLFITHLILDVAYATIWKKPVMGVDYAVSVFFHTVILLILVPLETFVLTTISKPLSNNSSTRQLHIDKND